MKFVDAADRCPARIDTAVPGAVEILRGDLVTLLAAGVDVGFGDSIRTLTQDEHGVTVTFANRGLVRRKQRITTNVRLMVPRTATPASATRSPASR